MGGSYRDLGSGYFVGGVIMAKKEVRKWSKKYKDSINCNHPKGFSQKQHCKYGKKSVRIKKVGKTRIKKQIIL